jgi:hypothetical protein
MNRSGSEVQILQFTLRARDGIAKWFSLHDQAISTS